MCGDNYQQERESQPMPGAAATVHKPRLHYNVFAPITTCTRIYQVTRYSRALGLRVRTFAEGKTPGQDASKRTEDVDRFHRLGPRLPTGGWHKGCSRPINSSSSGKPCLRLQTSHLLGTKFCHSLVHSMRAQMTMMYMKPRDHHSLGGKEATQIDRRGRRKTAKSERQKNQILL